MNADRGMDAFHAWDPGVTSTIPEALLPDVTLFRPEASRIDFRQAREIADFFGLSPTEVVAFTTERLIVHELLIRVTVDYSIPDGPNYEDLGLHLRSMVETIHRNYVLPDLEDFEDIHRRFHEDAAARIDRALAPFYDPPVEIGGAEKAPSLLGRLFGSKSPPSQPAATTRPGEVEMIADWDARAAASNDPLERACLAALSRIVGKIVGSRGRLIGDRALVGELAARVVCNEQVGLVLGDALEPYIRRAAALEGYQRLAAQNRPVIMNVKGASASGKSTIRWDQRDLAHKLGICWNEFAIISPDYWRKYFLEYESLGDDYKYGAMLTGQELAIVDKKLDQYLEAKALANAIPHILIDRFRFDTFNPKKDGSDKPPTRFGDMVYMFFMVTAPEETVERAWIRGLKTGRYKAVDDLLFHNVEAYSGMPDLFLSCAQRNGKTLHYEFLDNNVPKGEHPRTVAYGWNGHMTIVDIGALLDIDRYRRINIKARDRQDLYGEEGDATSEGVDFLKRCMNCLPKVSFVDHRTGRIYGETENGGWAWRDGGYLDPDSPRSATRQQLEAIGWFDAPTKTATPPTPVNVAYEKRHTLGIWAPDS